ncbi:MAG: N-acetylneuraminate synthase family protein [Mycolicibacterium sp.]|nr:N-acetylneuraminate synthase family protein [Mycolicibacterium sp.]
MRIGGRDIGPSEPCFVIAEIGNNHNGDFDRAVALVDAAIASQADCVKFQMRKLDEVYRSTSLAGGEDDLSVEYTIDLLRRFELLPDDHRRLKDYCSNRGIAYLCTPWDISSVRVLDSFGVEGYKVASADLTNLPLLAAMVDTGKPFIVSTGMSRMEEIRTVVEFLHSRQANFALLHCQSTYPAAFHNVNLRFMETLKELHPFFGYSGHERGISVTIAAVALGAQIVERHITLDRTMEGPDHAASLERSEFAALVAGIRETEAALGVSSVNGERPLSQGELINRENLAKSLVASRDIATGIVITEADVIVRSPGQGLSPIHLPELLGRRISRSMKMDDYFFPSDLQNDAARPRAYSFRRPWGVPVRFHDALDFMRRSEPDIVEFHLSYQDMERDLSTYFSGTYEAGFVVHAPELFSGSRLMDLASADEEYREFSIRETQKVIEITRALKRYFPNTEQPLIVLNIGGISTHEILPESAKPKLYDTFARSLEELDAEGVELTPQTMAPFPWHFGGQRHQNLFIYPEESARVCRELGLRMTVDVSHTRLASNHLNFDFYSGIATLGPYTAHYHLGDAKGVDGEGLQIGEGDIDFALLGRTMAMHAPAASFIPEIWQGHKNFGEGFWIALARLETFL